MKMFLRYCLVAFVAHAGLHAVVRCQDQSTQQQSQEPPKLEIPEITIVGKKAITLPFARKGELFDNDLYQAPPPDSSLLVQSNSMVLLKGTLPRYEQQEQPWRWSVEGLLGSFSRYGGRGFVDYHSQRWNMSGDLGGQSTDGHVTNANASLFSGSVNASTTLSTDNSILKSLDASFGGGFQHQTYGLFGITSSEVRRKLTTLSFHANLFSINRQYNALDAGMKADATSLSDTYGGADSSVSALSPKLFASYFTTVHRVKISGEISYIGSSLDYQHTAQSPSMTGIILKTSWQTSADFSIEVGGKYLQGTHSAGEDRTLTVPVGSLLWQRDSVVALSVWFEPDMEFHTYNSLLSTVPYIDREMVIDPQRMPVRFGSSVHYRSGALSFDVRGSYASFSNHELMIADSGRIHLEYAEAKGTRLDVDGEFNPSTGVRISGGGSVVSAHESGSSVQLPMVPLISLRGRAELDGPLFTTFWSSAEYQSSRNVDRAGTQSLKDYVLLNAGVSFHAIPRLVLNADVFNVFDTSYEWWSGYRAPGINFTVGAKLHLQ